MKVALPALALAVAVLTACADERQASSRPVATPVAAVLSSGAGSGHARALAPRPFRFPEDHGAHPDFRTEWWYFTGNLATADGRAFGFQLTFFRFALAPSAPPRRSALATRQAWMGHFAITDVAAGKFHAFERFARGAAGLAGARAAPLRIWIEDWEAQALDGRASFPLRLRARDGSVALDLVLAPGKPVVLQGERGLSRKSATAGNASYYYSHTRLPAAGEVHTPQGRFAVEGLGWLDREWGTSALAPDQAGWDWFSLQLDDGRDLMFYRLRDRAGGMHPFSAGVLVAGSGGHEPLAAGDVTLVPGEHWGAEGGPRYPVSWRLRAGALDLDVRAVLPGQEHRGAFRYWEGAVAATGRDGARPIAGRGYLEMTGY